MQLRRALAAAIAAGLFAGGVVVVSAADPAGAGGNPSIGLLVKKPHKKAKDYVRLNLAVGERKTVRMKLVSLTGDQEPGYIYEDLGNHPHTYKTRYFDAAGVEITDQMTATETYDVVVPAEGALRFNVVVKRKATSDAQDCVSPRVFEENNLNPDSGWITVNSPAVPASCPAGERGASR